MAVAKSKLGELVHEAETSGPQLLLRSGREVAMVVSIKEWRSLQEEKQKPRPLENMADFLLRSPLRGSGLKIERLKIRPRKLDL